MMPPRMMITTRRQDRGRVEVHPVQIVHSGGPRSIGDGSHRHLQVQVVQQGRVLLLLLPIGQLVVVIGMVIGLVVIVEEIQ